jgi:hypothetical protein
VCMCVCVCVLLGSNQGPLIRYTSAHWVCPQYNGSDFQTLSVH